MKHLPLFFLILLAACKVSKNSAKPAMKKMLRHGLANDSSFIYQIPFKKNKFVLQGYYGNFSHQNSLALDFKMSKGTKIYAARAGVVLNLKGDSNKRGTKNENRAEGNFIVIQHADSSRAGYWHLQLNGVVVSIGDTVAAGQHIGYSGNTGQSAMPHLHFSVWATNAQGKRQQIPVRFATNRGLKYLRATRFYKGAK